MTLVKFFKKIITSAVVVTYLFMLAKANAQTPVDDFLQMLSENQLTEVKQAIQSDSTLLKADLNQGNTALHIAAYYDAFEVTQYLVEQGAPLNEQNEIGLTALHYAVMQENLNVIALLLANKANVIIEDNDGYTALDSIEEGSDAVEHMFSDVEDAVNIAKFYNFAYLEFSEQYKDISTAFFKQHPEIVNFKFYDGGTLLHYTIELGNTEILPILLEHEMDINAQDYNGKTPLMVAAEGGHIEDIETLLTAGADTELTDNDYNTALELAMYSWAPEGATLIREHILKSMPHLSSLIEAIKQGQSKKALKLLANNRFSFSFVIEEKYNLLTLAAFYKQHDVFKKMVELGADVHSAIEYEYERFSSFDFAIQNNDTKLISILLTLAPDLLDDTYQAMEYVLASNNPHLFKLFLEKGKEFKSQLSAFDHLELKSDYEEYLQQEQADPELFRLLMEHKPEFVKNPATNQVDVIAIIENNQVLILEEVLKDNLVLDIVNEEGVTPVLAAVYAKNIKSLNLLLDKSPELLNSSKGDETVFSAAIRLSQFDVLAAFPERLPKLKGVDKLGNSIAHLLVEKSDISTLSSLLDSGISVSVVNNKGESALHLAVQLNKAEAAKTLLKFGANADLPDLQGNTALMLAIASDSNEMVNILLPKTDIHIKNKEGLQAAHFAAISGNRDILKLLKKAGAEFSSKDTHHLLPWHYAFAYGHSDVVTFLVKNIKEPKACNNNCLFDDPRFQYVSALYLAGDNKRAIKYIEKYLKNGDENPLLANSWLSYSHENDRDFEKLWHEAPKGIKQSLGIYGDIFLRTKQDNPQKLLTEYPASRSYSRKDLFALYALSDVAQDYDLYDERLSYLLKALVLAPEMFQTTWKIVSTTNLKSTHLTKIQETISTAEFENTAAKELLTRFINSPSMKRIEIINTRRVWLQQHPNDARASVSLGYELHNSNYYAEQLKNHIRGMVYSPFYSNYTQIASSHRNLGNVKAAQSYITKIVSVKYHQKKQDEDFLKKNYVNLMGDVAHDVGEESEARKFYQKGIEQWPTFERNYKDLAKIERQVGRNVEALALYEKALALKPDDIDILTSLINRSLSLERISSAQKYLNQLEKKVGLSRDVYAAKYKLANLQENIDDKKQLADSYWQERQSTQSLMDKLAWLAEQEHFDSMLTLIKGVAGKIYFTDANSTKLAKLLDKHPDIESVAQWQALMPMLLNQRGAHEGYVGVFLSDDKDKHDYWLALYQSDKNNQYALDNLSNLLIKDIKNWEVYYALFDEQTQTLPSEQLPLSGLSEYIIDYAWIVYRQSLRGAVKADRIDRVLAWLEDYKDHFGNLTQYHRYREFMFAAKQDKTNAAKELLQRSKLSKDSTSIFHDLVALYKGKNSANGFLYGHQMLQRNPYSKSMSRSFMHKHSMWGGSPIAVLREIDRIQRIGLSGVSYNDFQKKSLGQLGDTLSAFNRYKKYRGINNSQRYVDWFDSARNDALFKKGKTIQYDFNDEFNEVKIVDDEGFITIRRDHPIHGKLTLAQRGASWVKVNYTEKGKLRSINTSNNKSTQLEYDENDNIIKMVDHEARTLTFEYNEIGKPTLIEEVGVGSLNVSYDSNGEILKVSSDQGHKMALKLTQAFQNLLTLSKIPNKFLRSGDLPGASQQDSEYSVLRDAINEEMSVDNFRNYISFLIKNVKKDREYYSQAREYLDMSIEVLSTRFESGDMLKGEVAELIFVAQSWKQLMSTVKSQGLPLKDYSLWQGFKGVLKNAALKYNDRTLSAFIFDLAETPLTLLNNANWLHQSDFVNEGFWHRYANNAISKENITPNPNAILTRENGDLLLGTNKGLMVHNGHYWHHYAYDFEQQKLINYDASNKENVSVLSLLEVGSTLWLGTDKGLLKLNGEYVNTVEAFSSLNSSVKNHRVSAMGHLGDSIVFSTLDGLYHLNLSDDSISNLLAKIKIDDIVVSASRNQAILLTSKGLKKLDLNGDVSALTTEMVKSAIFLNEDVVWYLQPDNQIFKVNINQAQLMPQLMANSQDMTFSKAIHGLSFVDWNEETKVPVVLTDLGLNLFSENHMQFMELPFKRERQGQRLGPLSATITKQGDLLLLTEEAVYGYSPSQAGYLQGEVNDIVQDSELGGVYVAMKKGIYLLDVSTKLDSTQFSNRFYNANSQSIALSAKGDLFAHDNFEILRFKRGDTSPQVIFNAYPTVDEDIKGWWRGGVKKLFVDSNNILWVAAGSSVWRWEEGKDAQEFNYAIDEKLFPSRSHNIFNIYEDVNGNIRVVASDEGHIRYKGRPLEGGELIYKNGAFVRAEKPHHKGWFVSGYTPIDDETAVVATGSEFYRDKSKKRNSFNEIASYEKMTKDVPMIYLGGEGSQFNSDSNTWLFPSAGGIVAYHNERWFYPDRLNQLLPQDARLGQYGSRTVKSVHVDENGRIYAGTDIGLLVYDATNVESFLLSQNQGNLVFVDRDDYHLSSLKNIFIDQIDARSPQGKLIKQLQRMDNQINKLEEGMSTEEPQGNVAFSASVSKERKAVDIDDLKNKLNKREKSRQRLLAKLENEHYGLFQMLKLDPREAQQMGKKLQKDQVLVQYLPTPNSLFINVIGNKDNAIIEVPIGSEQLNKVISNASLGLREKSSLVRGVSVKQAVQQASGALSTNLTTLYDWLIRPIEHYLDNKSHVFISPINQLTYIPFSALIRKSGNKEQYAIERYNLGVIPSLYHLDLVLSHDESFASSELLAADPDGSLPGARKEIQNIKRYMDDPIALIGEEFSVDNLEASLEDARIVHLATHGVLNSKSPVDSYILLANGERLDIPTIATMNLSQTDLVVLSACETGVGKQGLEMATLARAFALSNVPTVVASLWKVDDASTARLMTLFYRAYQDEKDTVKAFAVAQRRMIKGESQYSHPSDWSAFNVIGKP